MITYFKYLPENILSQKIDKTVFPFSQFLFWDTPIEKIDIENHRNFIIERVLSRGLLQDFYFLLQLYTQQEIIYFGQRIMEERNWMLAGVWLWMLVTMFILQAIHKAQPE